MFLFQLKSSDVVESFITRIQEINPLLNCVIAPRFEEARAEAKKVDDLIESNVFTEEILAKEKPFFGVPFTTKDGIAVKGNFYTNIQCFKKHLWEALKVEFFT